MSGMRQSAPFVRFGINEVDVKTEEVAIHVIRPLAGFGLSWYKLAPAGTWSRQVLSSHPSRAPIRVRPLGELPPGDRDDARQTSELEVT
jgi:hypothetical protein